MANDQHRDRIPVWNQKPETFDDFCDRCQLWVLGTPKTDRSLLRPRLVISFPEVTRAYSHAKEVKKEEPVKNHLKKTSRESPRRRRSTSA